MNASGYLLLLGLLLSTSACQKEQPSPSAGLVGDWQWVRSIGGFTGRQVLKPALGQETLYRFTDDGQWSTCTNGVCSSPTSFTLQRERSVNTGDEQLILTLRLRVPLAPPDTGSHILLRRLIVREISDTLHLSDDGPDGYGEYYSKK
jgi:hypothetical protein